MGHQSGTIFVLPAPAQVAAAEALATWLQLEPARVEPALLEGDALRRLVRARPVRGPSAACPQIETHLRNLSGTIQALSNQATVPLSKFGASMPAFVAALQRYEARGFGAGCNEFFTRFLPGFYWVFNRVFGFQRVLCFRRLHAGLRDHAAALLGAGFGFHRFFVFGL